MERLPAVLDHVVINARNGIDAAAALFKRLGFALTPRGHDSHGTSNHLAVFGTNYLQLTGAPVQESLRKWEMLKAPIGLNGYVFNAANAEHVCERLSTTRAPASESVTFSRQVPIADEERPTGFRIVKFGDEFLDVVGRICLCAHSTRDSVWREEWPEHPNGATGIARTIWVAANVPKAAATLAKLFHFRKVGVVGCESASLALENSELQLMTHECLKAVYGGAASRGDPKRGYMAAIQIEVVAQRKVANWLRENGIPAHSGDGQVVVAASSAMNTTIEFIERRKK